MPAKAKQQAAIIDVPKMVREMAEYIMYGDSPLITNQPTDTSKNSIRSKQQGWPKLAKSDRDVQGEYHQATYWFPDGSFGIPAICIKKSMIEACRYVDGVAMAQTKGACFVQFDADDPLGALVHIEGVRTCREDTVRLASGVMDLRYRPQFWPWKITATINFNANVLNKEQVLNLIQHAGFHVGIGDWRPQGKTSTGTGQYGLFHVGTGAADEKLFQKQMKDAVARVKKDGEIPLHYFTPPSQLTKKAAK